MFPDEIKVQFGAEGSKPQAISRILHFHRLRTCACWRSSRIAGLGSAAITPSMAGDHVTLVGNPWPRRHSHAERRQRRPPEQRGANQGRRISIRSTPPSTPGWSGGPVIDSNGKVVAVVAMKADDNDVPEIRGAMGKLDEGFRGRIGRTSYNVGLTYGIPAAALAARAGRPGAAL